MLKCRKFFWGLLNLIRRPLEFGFSVSRRMFALKAFCSFQFIQDFWPGLQDEHRRISRILSLVVRKQEHFRPALDSKVESGGFVATTEKVANFRWLTCVESVY